jgi:hypothetical protein
MALSLYDEKRRQQDGFLRVPDIERMRLSSQLVVLSACLMAACLASTRALDQPILFLWCRNRILVPHRSRCGPRDAFGETVKMGAASRAVWARSESVAIETSGCGAECARSRWR